MEAAANSISPQKKFSSHDNGRSFISVVNLSNSTQTASEDFRIDAHRNHVAVFWWGRAAAVGGKEQPAVRIRMMVARHLEVPLHLEATTPIVAVKMSTE